MPVSLSVHFVAKVSSLITYLLFFIDFRSVTGIESFISEILLVTQLDHENIHKILGFTIRNNVPYSIREDKKGERLINFIQNKNKVGTVTQLWSMFSNSHIMINTQADALTVSFCTSVKDCENKM